MLFDMKSIVLYGLITLAHASPLPQLSKRAPKLGDYQCPDGTTLSENDIREALHQCRRLDDSSIGKYPAYFGNKSNNQKVFDNIPDSTDLREFPIVVGGVYTGGEPGAYRVVTDYKDNRGDFRGVMQHTGATVGGAYTACTRVTNSKREPGKDKHDKDKGDKKGNNEERSVQETENETNDLTKREPGKNKDDKNKHDKGKDDKKGNNEERSVQETETEITEDSTGHTVSDLTTRGKKKKVGSATCPDGVTLSQDAVANAFKECKKWNDYGVGGYPHKFGNMSGNSQVFEGVTKDLREYPIIEGGTWTGGEPGKYRVVTDYSDNFVGVMIENAGASFSRCTVNTD
ncbi:retrovirus-related Pol polyprotein from transposon TNT 1-94 [Aspergillus udagawae]|nr:retrovirus-related Pol polyprotein from transposon TNT 1-94 [Aspergillus udagawae]GFG03320.1 retrovirus-related Pol polyprotein from transposon TNT 1-94 [Aspergillus udagawae]GFG24926.1 retrovirus-related Pol polyprotein from transposon TNT 1-94 [Aspergillus udagawae]